MEQKVTVDKNICKGCGLCVHICPNDVMELDRKETNGKGYNPAHCIDNDGCISCGMCGIICPESAIRVIRPAKE